MKKYFMYVAFAAAGLLTSCSSESLTAGEDPQNPTPEDRVPIQIGVASPQAKVQTRGLGTVGDVSGGTNIWQGEKINVFMFEKGSLTLATDGTNPLYDNVALTTPKSTAQGGTDTNTGIAYEYYDASNPADGTDDRVRYKYYPVTGNFDFWGYYSDDAGNTAPTIGATEVTVPFTIDGSQDLMVAKAELTDAQNDNTNPNYTLWHAGGVDQTRYYSAYAARRNIQPNMTFKHLLTRLTFSVLAGNNQARGFKESTPGADDWAFPTAGVYDGVFVRSIKVRSKFTGNIIAAWISGSSADPGTVDKLITFDNTAVGTADPTDLGYDMLTLQGERNGNAVAPLYDETTVPFNDWNNLTAALTVTDVTNFPKIIRPKDLTGDGAPVGGALLVSSEPSYDIEIVLGQYLLDNSLIDGTDPKYKVSYSTLKKTIQFDSNNLTASFAQGTSYNVKITLYGTERIDITTTLQPWATGATYEVIGE